MALLSESRTESQVRTTVWQNFQWAPAGFCHARGFLIEDTKQINLRFPFRSMQVLQHFQTIDPKTIHGDKISLGPMAYQLPILFKRMTAHCLFSLSGSRAT